MQNPSSIPVHVLAILLSVLLGACTFETTNEAPDEGAEGEAVTGKTGQQTRWGQKKTFGPQWLEGSPQVLFQLDTDRETPPIRYPHVLNVALGLDLKAYPTGNGRFRYQVLAGTGGASRMWTVDAKPLQQVSLSASFLQVSLIAERAFVDLPFVSPGIQVDASAFAAIGNTSSERATYTQFYSQLLSGGTEWRISPVSDAKVPAGATGFRLVGNTHDASSPFVSDTIVNLKAGSSDLASYLGDDLLQLALSDSFIPLPGGVDEMEIINNAGAGAISVGVQWVLDL